MDFFPQVDVGLMKLHFRAPPGTRIEETERLVGQVEGHIRKIIPPEEIETINDLIGVPISITWPSFRPRILPAWMLKFSLR